MNTTVVWGVIGSALVGGAISATAYYRSSDVDNGPFLLMLCRGAEGDYNHCATVTRRVIGRAECDKQIEPAYWGIQAIESMKQTAGINITLTCAPEAAVQEIRLQNPAPRHASM